MNRDAERRARLAAAMRGVQTERPAPPPGDGHPGDAHPGDAGPGGPGPGAPRPGDARRRDARRRDARPGDALPAGPARPVAERAGGFGRLVDRRGVSAAGIVVVDLVAGFVGAAVDLTRGPQILGTVTAVLFAVGAIAAAVAARREDLAASVVVPPLAYAVVVLVSGNVTGAGQGSYLHDVAAEVVVHVVTSAPGLLIGTGGAAVVALVRFLGARSAANRRRAAARATARPGARP